MCASTAHAWLLRHRLCLAGFQTCASALASSPPARLSRRRDCHFADNLSPSLLKHLLKGGGRGGGRMTVSPTARCGHPRHRRRRHRRVPASDRCPGETTRDPRRFHSLPFPCSVIFLPTYKRSRVCQAVGAADIVVARLCVLHIPLSAREAVLGRCASWLRPGGVLSFEDYAAAPGKTPPFAVRFDCVRG